MSKEIIPNSLIGEGAEFKGKFKVAGSFRIDGYFEGELTVDDHLFISPIGRLKTTTVYTKTIAIAGIFMGNVDASEEVQLLSTGRVLGNIKVPRLIMEPGVVVQGSIDITGSASQHLDTIVAESFNSQNKNIIITDHISNLEELNTEDVLSQDLDKNTEKNKKK
ncbi:MAG: bactofilin family protein [Brevinema sp.]